MNPFNTNSEYDGYLAEIITKINKSPELKLNEPMKELIKYLPNSNYHSDYKIILKTIAPHFNGNCKETINKIVLFLAKKLGVKCLKSIQAKWLYSNFDSEDPYAKKLIEDYFIGDNFDINGELEKML